MSHVCIPTLSEEKRLRPKCHFPICSPEPKSNKSVTSNSYNPTDNADRRRVLNESRVCALGPSRPPVLLQSVGHVFRGRGLLRRRLQSLEHVRAANGLHGNALYAVVRRGRGGTAPGQPPCASTRAGHGRLLSLMLLIAGICLAASDATKYCGAGWHCHNLRAATAFDFIAMFFFLVSFGLTFVAAGEANHGLTNVQVEEPVPYHQNATPTSGGLSPIGHHNDGPAAKDQPSASNRAVPVLSAGFVLRCSGRHHLPLVQLRLAHKLHRNAHTLWFVVAVEIFNYSARLSTRVEQGIDGVLVFMLLIGGICLAASDYISYCDHLWHCHNLKAAVAFTFIGCSPSWHHLCCQSWLRARQRRAQLKSRTVSLEVTPTDALSPVQDLNSPGT
ncbi:hypothetical protein GQ600_17961 [Phytophthora cactorum]|nr:hypothetical protein GQ600_17961 [Phytophthora cactorum]